MEVIYLSLAILAFSLGVTHALEKPCGDWAPYKDEKCFKVFDDLGFKNYTDAEATCSAHDSGKLISITTKEEQEFLANYLFKQKQIVDTVWLGAKYSGAAYHWEDGTNLTFTNWASGEPKNQTDHCAQMNADGETVGKWVEEPCKKKNLVVCQKEQILSLAKMHTMLFQIRKDLVASKKQFQEDLAASERQFQAKLAQLKASLSPSASSLPIGFIYTQYPKEKAPTDIWPSITWTDVTSQYEGVFFRAAGGSSGSFGAIQEENVPRIDAVQSESCWNDATGKCHSVHATFSYSTSVSLPTRTTGWSDYVGSKFIFYSGSTGEYNNQILHRYHTTAGEVRPRNMAVKVWKRTG